MFTSGTSCISKLALGRQSSIGRNELSVRLKSCLAGIRSARIGKSAQKWHLIRLAGFADVPSRGLAEMAFVRPILPDVPSLSGEGVVSSYSVVATGLVSRHRSEFGTFRAAQSCGLEAIAQAILGALKSLQRPFRAAYDSTAASEPFASSLPAP